MVLNWDEETTTSGEGVKIGLVSLKLGGKIYKWKKLECMEIIIRHVWYDRFPPIPGPLFN